jgi:Arc/MetJ family transcription regulator
MTKTLIDLDDDALPPAMAHYGTTVKKEAVNRALREAAGRREAETEDLADWFAEVGRRMGDVDYRAAWRQ